MCQDCWINTYGHAKVEDLPENWEMIDDLIDEIYAHNQGGTGGPLHVQLDDWNIEGEWKPYVSEAWPVADDLMQMCQRLCDLMNPLAEIQRATALARYYDYI